MAKKPLVPTTVVNKNGVTTTVHKRMDSGSQKRGSSIPKIGLFPVPEDTCKVVVESSFASELNYVKMSPKVREKMMDTLHADTLSVMESILREHNDGIHTFRKAAGWSAASRNLALVNGYVALLNESESKDRDAQLDILYALRGVQYCRPTDVTNLSDKNAEGALALVRVLRQSLDSGLVVRTNCPKDESAYVFNDPEVGTMIIENPKHADEIVDLYRHYGHFNKGLFHEALANGVNGLKEGAL